MRLIPTPFSAAAGARPAVPREAPVLPEREEARQWAIDELGRTVYQEARPSWFESILAAVVEWFTSLLENLEGINANLGIVIIIVAAFLAIGIAIRLVRPRANRKLTANRDVFDDKAPRSAEDHRQAAGQTAAEGLFAEAAAEQFRAIVRSAEERVIIDPQPGRTAHEVTQQLGFAYGLTHGTAHGTTDGTLQADLRSAGELFDAVRYGNRRAHRADYDFLAAVDLQLQRRPAAGRPAGGSEQAVPQR